jgi:hypothetical protein
MFPLQALSAVGTHPPFAIYCNTPSASAAAGRRSANQSARASVKALVDRARAFDLPLASTALPGQGRKISP